LQGNEAALGPRNENAYLPFGAGARLCIGWRFALQEARLVLIKLYQNFTFELAPGQVPLQVRGWRPGACRTDQDAADVVYHVSPLAQLESHALRPPQVSTGITMGPKYGIKVRLVPRAGGAAATGAAAVQGAKGRAAAEAPAGEAAEA
jgi:hypothetical protein